MAAFKINWIHGIVVFKRPPFCLSSKLELESSKSLSWSWSLCWLARIPGVLCSDLLFCLVAKWRLQRSRHRHTNNNSEQQLQHHKRVGFIVTIWVWLLAKLTIWFQCLLARLPKINIVIMSSLTESWSWGWSVSRLNRLTYYKYMLFYPTVHIFWKQQIKLLPE